MGEFGFSVGLRADRAVFTGEIPLLLVLLHSLDKRIPVRGRKRLQNPFFASSRGRIKGIGGTHAFLFLYSTLFRAVF